LNIRSSIDLRISMNASLVTVQALQQNLGFGAAQFSRSAVPDDRRAEITQHAPNMGLVEKIRIKTLAQSQRCLRIAGIGGTLIEESRRRHVADTEEFIATFHKPSDLRGDR
jgi:hypothetical protein